MAAHSGGHQPLCGNTETAENQGQPKELSEFIKTAVLPVCVCVISGKHLTSSVQITKGDIIFLKSCETMTVTLTHQCSDTGSRKQVNVPLDFPHKFTVLPPKSVSDSDRAASMIMYPSIGDLLLDTPTYFEATSSYDDPYLPGFSIHRGDRFRFRGLATDPKDGHERLKVVDELDNVLLLSLNCRANFCPLEDEESYTLRQLIEFGPVPRRLRLSKGEPPTDKGDETITTLTDTALHNENKDISQLIDFPGVIHMLKPNLSITASPLNDSETVWKIPLTADLCVRQHDLDDYEVPSVVKSQPVTVISLPPTPQTPTFPAPPTPPMPQPLVPVNVYNFPDIYGCPVKARVMDMSKCNDFLQSLVQVSEDVTVYRIEKTKRLYAEDMKDGKVYSFGKDVNLSFIEYPEKFSEISELLRLPIGTEITVLEDIASDFPSPFFLQFGDILRLVTNTSYSVKPKHTSIECKILKCEKVNREGGANTKMKLPLDFEVKMVISTDPNDRRVINLRDIVKGTEPIPCHEVATLIDSSEKELEDVPVNLKVLKTLPERMLVVSPFVYNYENRSSSSPSENHQQDWPSPSHDCEDVKNIGISLTSGLVLAFRERLDMFEVDVMKAHAAAIQVPLEVLTRSEYEERERICKVWAEEEETEVQSVASDDPPSTIEKTSQDSNNSIPRKSEKRVKKIKMDKIRRLSQVLNPKHWRPAKAAPEPLPHPSAMGLMALSMRPHADQNNDYQNRGQDERTSHSSVSISSDEENNVYEDVEIGPLRSSASTLSSNKKESKGFSGAFHKSLPKIVSRTYNRNRANRRAKTMLKQSTSSPIHESSGNNQEDANTIETVDEDPIYDCVQHSDEEKEKAKDTVRNKTGDVKTKKETKKEKDVNVTDNSPLKTVPIAPQRAATIPPLPPRRSSSSLEEKTSAAASKYKSLDSLSSQSMRPVSTNSASDTENSSTQNKIILSPPIPPQRKKRIKSLATESESKPSSTNSDNPVINSNPIPSLKEVKSENSHAVKNDEEKDLVPHSTTTSEKVSEEKKLDVEYSKIDISTKKVNPQKVPIPKPRGLKKPKVPEFHVRLDSTSSQDSEEKVQVENSTTEKDGQTAKEDSDKSVPPCNAPVTKLVDTELPPRTERSDRVRDLVKPKPPPKPKPRITT